MKIINNGFKKGYLIHKTTENNYSVCRILNEYNSLEDAKNDLIKLLSKRKTEKDLLKKYSNK